MLVMSAAVTSPSPFTSLESTKVVSPLSKIVVEGSDVGTGHIAVAVHVARNMASTSKSCDLYHV